MACGATLTLKRSLEFDPFHGQPAKRRCLLSANGASVASSSPVKQSQQKPSPFANLAAKVTSEQIVARINSEIKRMHQHRRRNLMGSPPAVTDKASSSVFVHKREITDSSVLNCAVVLSTPGISGLSGRDAPVLSLRQAGLVCERMMKEREDQLREEYDRVLNDKLNEQYEAFLKFNHDQLHRKFGETAASYVS